MPHSLEAATSYLVHPDPTPDIRRIFLLFCIDQERVSILNCPFVLEITRFASEGLVTARILPIPWTLFAPRKGANIADLFFKKLR